MLRADARYHVLDDCHLMVAQGIGALPGPVTRVLHVDAHADMGLPDAPLNAGNFLTCWTHDHSGADIVWVVPSAVERHLELFGTASLYSLVPSAAVGSVGPRSDGFGIARLVLTTGASVTVCSTVQASALTIDDRVWLDVDLDFLSFEEEAGQWLDAHGGWLTRAAARAGVTSLALSYGGGTTRRAELGHVPRLVAVLAAGRRTLVPSLAPVFIELETDAERRALVGRLVERLHDDPDRQLRTAFFHESAEVFLQHYRAFRTAGHAIPPSIARLVPLACLLCGDYEGAVRHFRAEASRTGSRAVGLAADSLARSLALSPVLRTLTRPSGVEAS